MEERLDIVKISQTNMIAVTKVMHALSLKKGDFLEFVREGDKIFVRRVMLK